MRYSSSRWMVWSTVVLAIAVIAMAPAAQAQVDVTIGGDAVPGGTATATVSTTDGSTISSVTWTQVKGATAALSGADTATVSAALADLATYKAHMFDVLAEPPISAADLPSNVPVPAGEFAGGLQNRFYVVGLNPFNLEHTAAVVLEAEVVTSSGTYTVEADIVTAIPWKVTTGVMNVPTGIPVVFHGKTQAAYDWAMTLPAGSAASLMDSTGQNPEFVPDVAGKYEVAVTDEDSAETVRLTVYAGTWRGIIVGQDADGNPVADEACTVCHNGDFVGDQFTPWAKTGHAEIFSSQIDTSTHYSSSCFACHTVGYDPEVANGGIDEASDYQAFLDAGLLNNPGDNWTTILEQFPETAKRANIQCENCHGPQDSSAHSRGQAFRGSLSSDMCASCHGEPLRHGRYQQWQLSAHANYDLAIEEGQNGTCSKCHTGNGFLAWLPVLAGEVAGDPNDSVDVTWTPEQTHPQTCQTCHDPHAIGDVSGDVSNATVRISGDTPELLAGFTATDVGRGAICMTCHNTRRGLRNDSTWNGTDMERAPHLGAQSDVLMGQNAYFVQVGARSYHSLLDDTCATCHMETTPPPDDISYNQGGTNHTFYARNDICSECHSVVTAEDVQGPFEMKLEALKEQIEDEIFALITAQTAAGNSIDLGGDATITSASQVAAVEFEETHGRQGMAVTFTDSTVVGPIAMNSVKVVSAGGDAVNFYSVADESLPKAGWNYNLLHSDGSRGVHNPAWTTAVLESSKSAIENGGGGSAVDPGGVGPVACTSTYTYWAEIATHAPGNEGSLWRTDVAAKNNGAAMANVEFMLHTASGVVSTTGAIDAFAQGAFEDLVGTMGVDDKGALEICSDQPLQIVTRVFNQSDNGTFGQFIDGVAGGGLTQGKSARLLGLRQMTGAYRTNISVTNASMAAAEVKVTLYTSAGAELMNYNLTVGSGMVVQDLSPFQARANQPDLGWGFATVEVVSGEGILASASVVDNVSNDGTTIPMKR